MNNPYGITTENLLFTLPQALKSDPDMVALATVIADLLTAHLDDIERAGIYARIDRLPEDLLDILAYDFKVDWWDGDYTLAQKRQTLKDNWRVHRILGTKAAVETAIAAIYPDTKVMEWFEYGGEPYHFRLLADTTYEHIDADKHRRVLERVAFYKNLRSVFDGIEYYASGTALAYAGVGFIGEEFSDGAVAANY